MVDRGVSRVAHFECAFAGPHLSTSAHELACTKATIAGASECITAGRFSKKAAEQGYRKYGYTGNDQDNNGRWHLRKR